MNKIILSGNMTRDPELRYTGDGTPVCSFGIAVNRITKDAEGNREVDFFNITAWRKTAEYVAQYLQKGRKIELSGRVQNRSYVGNGGVKRTSTEVTADEVSAISPPPEVHADQQGTTTTPRASAPANPAPPSDDGFDTFADPFSED